MRVAVVGAGISGLVSAYVLAKAGVNVVLYEKEDYLGGVQASRTVVNAEVHDSQFYLGGVQATRTLVNADGFDLDLGFMLLDPVTYPNIMEFCESLGVDMKLSHLSISISLDNGQGYEWGSKNGLCSLFAQRRNVFNPYFWKMISEVINFKEDVLSYLHILETNPDIDHNETLGQFIKSRGYSKLFQKAYLIPLCGSIWPYTSEGIMRCSAFLVLSFFRSHHLLQVFEHPQCLIVKWNSQNCVKKVKEDLLSKNCQIKANCKVQLVSTSDKGCVVFCEDGSQEMYDGCIMAVRPTNALRILGDEATSDERRILETFQYVSSYILLHRDKKFMPQNPAAWSTWNFLGTPDNNVCVTYWLNILQNIGETSQPFLITLNPDSTPNNALLKRSICYLLPTIGASKALSELDHIQGKRKIWFSRPYQGYGYHGDALKVGMDAAYDILGSCCDL